MNFTVEHGCFQYKNGPEILRNVSFTIGQRQILSVLGPNGVGKTTLIKCMLGLLPWNSGMSTLDGVPCTGGESRKIWRKVAYVPQRKQAGFAYTVGEMVLLGRSAHLGLLSMPGERDRAIAANAMEKTGTTHLAHKLCSRISGGEWPLSRNCWFWMNRSPIWISETSGWCWISSGSCAENRGSHPFLTRTILNTPWSSQTPSCSCGGRGPQFLARYTRL